MTQVLVIICLSILIFVHELGHFGAAKLLGIKVEKFSIGFGPKVIGKKIGETEYAIRPLLFGGFVKIHGEHREEIGVDKNRAFYNQPTWKKSIVYLAGVTMNILLGWIALTIIFTTGVPEHLMITDIAGGSPAQEAGIQGGDIILEARVANKILTDPISTENFIETTKANRGETLLLTLQRDTETINTEALIRRDPPEGQGAIGIALVDIGFAPTPFPENITEGIVSTWETLKIITISFGRLITGVFTNPQIAENVSGPVGILAVATRAGNLGFVYLAQLMALISLNLAVLNLIPFPALDGGQFLMALVEKISGKPTPTRAKIIINAFGMGTLLILMVLVTIRDISNLIN